ncbi:hypothetical protein HY442_01645 [Candidatus Parcubacteria bacterium]|nr:hypothetical protein [Candidatus Parcubacteria bacterium]MBI4099215.1 hypothetical protein [Candidatus Parcubacteria bacterium]MBI4385206.1 hypothetical protein [Candidatus Parcubacteria bacterium]
MALPEILKQVLESDDATAGRRVSEAIKSAQEAGLQGGALESFLRLVAERETLLGVMGRIAAERETLLGLKHDSGGSAAAIASYLECVLGACRLAAEGYERLLRQPGRKAA